MISSAASTACGFSIFAISGSRVCRRTLVMSSADPHERQRHQVDPDRLSEAEHIQVLLRDRRQPVRRPGDVEALAGADQTADLDLGVDLAFAGANRIDSQPDPAVGQVDDVARNDRLDQARPADRHPTVVALLGRAAQQYQRIAPPQLCEVVLERPDPQLRSRQVLEDRDLTPSRAGRRPHPFGVLGVDLQVAVGEVQAGDVEPGLDHLNQYLGFTRRRADRRDDLGPAH